MELDLTWDQADKLAQILEDPLLSAAISKAIYEMINNAHKTLEIDEIDLKIEIV